MQPSEFARFKESLPKGELNKSDIDLLENVVQELKRLDEEMRKDVIPKLRLLGLSKGHDQDKIRGKHPQSKNKEAPQLDESEALRQVTESLKPIQSTFTFLRSEDFEKLKLIALTKNSKLADNVGDFILNIRSPKDRPMDIARSYIKPIELITDIELAINRTKQVIEKLHSFK